MELTIRPSSKLSLNLRELWQHRELLYFFTWRDVKVKYKQTALGILWVVLQPLLLVTTLVLFFHKGLKAPTGGMPPALFYLSGLLLWNLFGAGLNGAANSLVEQANLLKKVYFPRIFLPFSSIMAALVDFAMVCLMFACALSYFAFQGVPVNWWMLLWTFPFGLLLTLVSTVGIGLLLASLNVQYRDFRYLLPFALQFLFFLTPVVYPLHLMENEETRLILGLNPMTGVMSLARAPFVAGSLDWGVIAIGVATASFILLTGLYTFRSMEAYFADLA